MLKRYAFTLAEVLITLGIIGVVAAMTIPNLMTAYQKQQTEARLKQAYSVLTNAVRLSESENGNLDIPTDMGMSSHDLHLVFQESIAPYLAGASRISNTSIGWNGVNAAGGSGARTGDRMLPLCQQGGNGFEESLFQCLRDGLLHKRDFSCFDACFCQSYFISVGIYRLRCMYKIYRRNPCT